MMSALSGHKAASVILKHSIHFPDFKRKTVFFKKIDQVF